VSRIEDQVALEMERDYASQSMHGCGAIGRIAIGYYKTALKKAGFVIMPVKPTREMIMAGWNDGRGGSVAERYEAMRDAAPPVP
jgi:hypothetical protein